MADGIGRVLSSSRPEEVESEYQVAMASCSNSISVPSTDEL